MVNGKNITILDKSYNANPLSVRASISELSLMEGKRKILILGDMFELGVKSVDYHLELLEYILKAMIPKVAVIGDYVQHLYRALPDNIKLFNIGTVNNIKLYPIIYQLQEEDCLLVQGSNSIGLDKKNSN